MVVQCRLQRYTAVLIGAAVLFVWADAFAQGDITESRRNAIVRAVEQAAPGVVSINVLVQDRARRLPGPFQEFWDFFEPMRPQVRKIDTVGSGFIFRNDGYALTNYHVIEDSYVHSVTLPDGRELRAELVGADPRLDIAVLRVDGKNLPVLPFGDSSDLMIGEWCIAIGNPFGDLIGDPQPTISVGVISAVNRRVSRSVGRGERLYQNLIQTDAAINPGNSGGPLVNAAGKVIGVNTMIFSFSGGNQGLGFAIPATRARRSAEEVVRYGRRRDPWPGFRAESVQALRPDILRQAGVTTDRGCLVIDILKRAPAYESGLRAGDVILEVNGNPIVHSSDIDFAFWELFVGDSCTLLVVREGREFELTFPVVELDRR